MAARKAAPRKAPVSIRLTPPERVWLDTVRAPGETDGATVKRVWRVGRLVLESDDPVASLTERIRRAREALDA